MKKEKKGNKGRFFSRYHVISLNGKRYNIDLE